MKSPLFLLLVLVSMAAATKVVAPKNCKAAEGAADPKKCATLCSLQNTGRMDEKGEIIIEKFAAVYKQSVTECASKNKQENLCLRATTFYLCYYLAKVTTAATSQANQCAKETNTVINATHITSASIKYDDQKACYHRCILLKNKKINEQNEVALNMFVGAKVNKDDATKKCYSQNNQEDKCLQAIRRITCVTNELANKKCKAAETAADPRKCADLCNNQHTGKMDEKGEIILDKFAAVYKPSVTECASKNKQQNLCERATAFNQCYFNAVVDTAATLQANQCAKETNTIINATHITSSKYDDQKACYHRCILLKNRRINEQNEVAVNMFVASKVNKDDATKKCYGENNQEDKCLQAIKRITCVTNELAKNKCHAAETADEPKKCAVLCNYQHFEQMDDKGEIILEKFPTAYKSAVIECAAKNKQHNICQRAVDFNICYQKLTPKKVILILRRG